MLRTIVKISAFVLLLGLLVGGTFLGYTIAKGKRQQEENREFWSAKFGKLIEPKPSPEVKRQARITEAIAAAGDYLIKHCLPSGQFIYRINLDPLTTPKRKYNMLRHAGTIYSLAMLYEQQESAALKDTIERSIDFLRSQISVVDAISNEDGAPLDGPALALWSKPSISNAGKDVQAKLGGTGLALLALVKSHMVLGQELDLELVRGLGRFIVAMQRADGSFYSKFVPSYGGKDGRWVSLYYPGEAALGLLMLNDVDPAGEWWKPSVKALQYLARIREGKSRVEADHWALLATAKAMRELKDKELPREQLIQHGVQIAYSILVKHARYPRNTKYYGSFLSDGRTTPTSTRLEGLFALYAILDEQHAELKQQIKALGLGGIIFLVRSQVKEGRYRGGVPRAFAKLPKDHPNFSVAFNQRANEVRIDYVQHALSAMIQYQSLDS